MDNEIKNISDFSDAKSLMLYAIELYRNKEYINAFIYAYEAYKLYKKNRDEDTAKLIFQHLYYLYIKALDADPNYIVEGHTKISEFPVIAYRYRCYIERDGLDNTNQDEAIKLLKECFDDFNHPYFYNEHQGPAIRICNDVISCYDNINQRIIDKDDAIAALKILMELCPEDRLDYLLQASSYGDEYSLREVIDIYIEDNDYDTALEAVENTPKLYNKDEYINFIKGVRAFIEGEYDDAIRYLSKRYYHKEPRLAQIYFHNLGGHHFDIDRCQKYIDRNDPISDSIDEQRRLDITYSKEGGYHSIPHLEEVLRNENNKIYQYIRDRLHLDLDDDTISILDNIKINFSYELKEDIYKPTKEDLLSIISQIEVLLDSDEELIDILNRIKEAINQGYTLEQLNNEFANVLGDYQQKYSEDKPDVSKLIDSLSKSFSLSKFVTMGTYSPSNKEITLYLLNIYNACKKNSYRNEIYLMSVYAHELFHAYHYHVMNIDADDINLKGFDIVLESLASYFQYLYTNQLYGYDEVIYKQEPSIHVADSIKNSWEYDMYIYPYSGALYMFNNDMNYRANYSLFRNIFIKSLDSFSDAFELINMFYKLSLGILL